MRTINKVFFYVSLFLMSTMFSLTKNIADLDLWHRMAVGKIFSQLNHIIYHDIFTYFPSKPLWVDHEWLSGIIFYNTGHYFGDYGITFLKVFILFSILVLIYKTSQLIYPEPDKFRISYYIVTFIAVFIGLTATLRCQAFTYLFFTLWIYILERIRRGENRLIWVFPVTTLIWANMHAGFLAGFGLIAFYAIGELLNKKNPLKYIGILALCIPVTFINPYGVKYWPYLIDAVTMKRPFITEWEPLHPFEYFYKILGIKLQFLFLIASLVYKMFSKDRKFDWIEVIAFTVTIYLGIKHIRHIIFFSIITGVYGYKHFVIFIDAVFNKVKDKLLDFIDLKELNEKLPLIYFARFSFVYTLIIGLCLSIIVHTPVEITLEHYPTKAIEFIRINNLKGNLLVPFNWGSYALWKLYPQNLVSIDGRYEETYTNQAYMDISAITFVHPNWQKTFHKYHHDVILMYKKGSTQRTIRKFKDWKVAYQDKKAVVFVPSTYPNKKWKQPNQSEKYYIKTKYENNIDF